MTQLKRFVLYLVPVVSMGIFLFYVWTAAGPWAAKWGSAHGVDVAIVNNYRYVNLVSLLAWTTVLIAVAAGRLSLARLAAIFASGYVLCDVIFYLPMAQLAGEHLAFDQFLILAVQAGYAIFLPSLSDRRWQKTT